MARRRQAARQASRLWKLQQRRDLARVRQARGYGNCSKGETCLARMRQASRLWKLPLMLWKVEQNRHLARMRQASRQAFEAMEIAAKERLG